MGRPRKSQSELLLSGSRRVPKGVTIEDAIKAEAVEQSPPQRPEWMTDEVAVNTWDRLVKHLANENLLSDGYQNLMIRYCCSWSRWRRLVDHIDEVGEVFERVSKTGVRRQSLNPAVKIVHDLNGELLTMERVLKMTPKSGGRLSSKPSPKPDPKLRFFRNDDPA